ncbi:MAG: V-type ATP synthase subunit D [Candidatus Omnitrophota bacterium]
MSKLKLTKGELKIQRDALKQYERYLPTLQLKKQQLQIEILRQTAILEEKKRTETKKINSIEIWVGLLTDQGINIQPWIKPKEIIKGTKNIAGVDLPLFERLIFEPAEYDLFITPLWVDAGIDALRELISLREEISVINRGIHILRDELRVTTQRVNLFERVKIPEAQEAIRLIKIYLGDQMANAVGRSKIAKRKIEKIGDVSIFSDARMS